MSGKNWYAELRSLRERVAVAQTDLTQANEEIKKLKDSLDIAIVALEEVATTHEIEIASDAAVNALDRIREFEWEE